MRIWIEKFSKEAEQDLLQYIPDKTRMILTSGRYDICKDIKEYCQNNKIGIIIIKPEDSEKSTDFLNYLQFICTSTDEFIYISDKQTNEMKLYIHYAKNISNKPLKVICPHIFKPYLIIVFQKKTTLPCSST